MIEISNVTKQYGNEIIVDNLTLGIKNGTIFGFIGPNGAGKTTTIKMLVGLNEPDSGEILIDKRKAKNVATKKITGYMPEDPYFYDHLTGYEFLEFCYSLSACHSRSSRESTIVDPRLRGDDKMIDSSHFVDNTLNTVGLLQSKNKMINTYSKGMKQRLGLAQAIIHQPKYIFLDEPLDGLDPIGRNDFKKILNRLKKQGSTIFLNSHILSDVEELCDEIGIIHRGKLLHAGKVSDFCKKGDLENNFVRLIQKQDE